MSTQENVQIVKDFFAAMGRGDKQGLDCWRFLPKTLSGPFRASGRWPARTADTRDWRICFRRLPKCWKRHTQSRPNS
jgi:ketosteroid isomerase-like protein